MFTTVFLSLSTVDILGPIILCCGVLSSIPGLYSLDASS